MELANLDFELQSYKLLLRGFKKPNNLLNLNLEHFRRADV